MTHSLICQSHKSDFTIQSHFDERDSLKREKAYKREISDSCQRQNVTTFSGVIRRVFLPPAYRDLMMIMVMIELMIK
jgi:hypothetical protein